MANKPYTIRVSIAHNGYSSHQTFVRPVSMVLDRQAFNAYAVGTMLTMLITGYTDSLDFSGTINGNRIDMAGFDLQGYAVDVITNGDDADEADIRFRAAHGM